MNKTWVATLFFGVGLLLSVKTFAVDAPVGVRPCCAFGTELKAKVGRIQVPFFSLSNVVAIDDLGQHQYNDGSQGVASSLLGIASETNGLIYTRRGGFIDTAHVRDTADYTYYLYHQLWPHVGTDHQLDLFDELRTRRIQLHAVEGVLDNDSKRQLGLALASSLAYQLAQWHEVAQWFGLTSVGGWSELASAFSPEDLYSNMQGALLARDILQASPLLDIDSFSEQLTQALAQRLQRLGAQDSATTKANIEALDGAWWNSQLRLPDKWVLQRRDYRLAFSLLPHGAEDGQVQSLPDNLFQYGELILVASANEGHFSALPAALRQQSQWQHQDIRALAAWARGEDLKQAATADIYDH
ncbi:DUF4056 domain-containing protein [Shewanella sp. NIFS-20-20]|uniref:DUF4056 domain-containing protein n=1 Tax=Shewanella sp. NIFS-20-20 TaxID=2853806 RepID=UPI001C44D753|nr:DUF4056 domain-containing protein [Shewanella sp. NIFS-20-20]MBV7316237.1 DUF4056 domain-containing protein [Shewanella sp. NIFS-20-20]